MELDPAVREFLGTKPDSGDPAQPIATRRAISLALTRTWQPPLAWHVDVVRSLREAHTR
jgi:hypothetical protein